MKKNNFIKTLKIIGMTLLLLIMFYYLPSIINFIFSLFVSREYESDFAILNAFSILISLVIIIYLWIKGFMRITDKKSKIFSNSIKIKLNKKDLILIISVSLSAIIICSVLYLFSNKGNVDKENNEILSESLIENNKNELDFSIVNVSSFYNGQEGFSLSIPSGNMSVCIWTYYAGSGAIPNLVTTEARTATEKHTISVYGGEEDLKVSCVNDFGDMYIGTFLNK